VCDVRGGGTPGHPGHQVRHPHVADQVEDVPVTLGRLGDTQGLGEHALHESDDVLHLGGGGVREHEGAHHRLGQVRVALHHPRVAAEHEHQPLAGVSPATRTRSSLSSARSDSRARPDTGRWTFEGK
jgi:hypothetical protein